MIVAPDMYYQVQAMNIATQHSIYKSLNMNMPWMGANMNQTTPFIKSEPQDEDYGQTSRRDKTPPPLMVPPYHMYPTPPIYMSPPNMTTPPTPARSPPESSSNSETDLYENGDPLKKLQMTVNRTGPATMASDEKLVCPVCQFVCRRRPEFNEHLTKHVFKCSMCDEYDGEDAEKLREHVMKAHEIDDDGGEEENSKPKVNSQGKYKVHKCKHCDYQAVTKNEFWDHLRSHIKEERQLHCCKCKFVTEYKHHLEYHVRNHFNCKPFSCEKCSYKCVNKSMLNSHSKSHSDVCQFRCADCRYASKYCHSLKLHLRKYNHRPAMVLNPDGTPNPLPIVDVYGTRRGPKLKRKQLDHLQHSPPSGTDAYTNALLSSQMPFYDMNEFSNKVNGNFPYCQDVSMEEKNNNIQKEEVMEDEMALDLSRPEPEPELAEVSSCPDTPQKKRRKGKAYKLDTIALRLQHEVQDIECQPELPSILPDPDEDEEPRQQSPLNSMEVDSEDKADDTEEKQDYTCQYCDITFRDLAMYTMHMGYHGFDDPFKCNICGYQSKNKLAFFIHVARSPHT